MAAPQSHRIGPREYLEVERKAEYRSEYLDGEVFAMAGGTPAHGTILMNLTVSVGTVLKGGACRGFTSDTKVSVENGSAFFYPDLTLVCGEPRWFGEGGDALLNPVAVFEVLSPSTEAFDRGVKFERYRQIPTLRLYVLIAQDRPSVEVFRRAESGDWSFVPTQGLKAVVDLPEVGCRLGLGELYEGVEFTPKPQM